VVKKHRRCLLTTDEGVQFSARVSPDASPEVIDALKVVADAVYKAASEGRLGKKPTATADPSTQGATNP
jgi:hypothetical protein